MENQNPQSTPAQDSSVNPDLNISQTPPPVLKKRSKIIYVLIALFVVIFLGSAVTFGMKYFNDTKEATVLIPPPSPTATSVPDPSIGWGNYTNSEGDYGFKYPKTWVLNDSAIYTDVRGTASLQKNNSKLRVFIQIATLNHVCGLNCQKMSESDFFNEKNDFYKTGDIGGGGPGTTVEKVSETSIGGKRTIVSERHPTREYADGGNFTSPKDLYINYYVYLGNPNNEILQITLSDYVDDKEGHEEFDQLLSTLKFTDSTSQNNTTNWKTYTSDNYSFQYPKTWKELTEENNNANALDNNKKIFTGDICVSGGCGGFHSGIHVYVQKNSNNYHAREYFQKVVVPEQKGCGDVKEVGENQNLLSSYDAIIAEGFCGAGTPGPTAYIVKDNYVIVLASDSIDKQTVYQILSTFKFTN